MYIYSWDSYPVIEISNNSFINNENMRGIWLNVEYSENFRITNNIFTGLEYGITRQNGSCVPIIDYCLFDDIVNYHSNSNLGANCIEDENPHLYAETYQPIWNSTTKSPCIDAGDPSITDADGTPSDIGAVCATPHKYDIIDLPSPEVDSGWKWLSFPALDDIYSTENYDPDVAGDLLESILDPVILDVVEAQDYTIAYEGPGWFFETNQFYSTQGFKFHMNQAAELEVSGFIENPNTQMELVGGSERNWLGYFLEESQLVTDAFAQIWDDLFVIQTQHWTMTKINNVWYYWQTPRPPVLEYGDMINVRCYNDHSDFQWCNDTPGDEEETIPETEYFLFTEKADYIPIYVEFDPEDIPAEIGVFVDGVCKGAAAVKDTTAQILAYIVEGEQGNVEFEFYYNSRSENKRLETYNCVSSQNPYQVQQQINVKDKPDAWLVTFREGSNIISAPDEVSLSNYPNPFNPTTTISYSLPREGKISLSIYNIKGQLVKQLVSGSQPEGYYEIVWNGKDDTGKQVSSGIYYYRITACGKTLNKKMLMLK